MRCSALPGEKPSQFTDDFRSRISERVEDLHRSRLSSSISGKTLSCWRKRRDIYEVLKYCGSAEASVSRRKGRKRPCWPTMSANTLLPQCGFDSAPAGDSLVPNQADSRPVTLPWSLPGSESSSALLTLCPARSATRVSVRTAKYSIKGKYHASAH